MWLLGVQSTRMPEDFVKILRMAGNILHFNKVSMDHLNYKLSRPLNDMNLYPNQDLRTYHVSVL